MKKLMMAAAMAFGCLAAFGGGGGTDTWTDANGLKWTFKWTSDSSGEFANITSMSGYASDIAIPGTVKTTDGSSYKVTGIGGSALANHNEIESVEIPASVTTIGNYAFYNCKNLSNVRFRGKIPSSWNFTYIFLNTPFLKDCNNINSNTGFSSPDYLGGKSFKVYGNNYLAMVESSDPLKAIDPNVRGTKWYRWTAPTTGQAWIGTTAASTFDTIVGVYQGSSLYSLLEVASNNDFLKGGQSMVSFKATAGEEYRICVGGADGNRGEYYLELRMGSSVTLTLDPTGGVFTGADVPSTFTVPKNAAVGDLPTPEKTYYVFQGWYTKKSGGSKVTAKTKFKKNTKLYARWTKQKYKVTLIDGIGGILGGAKKLKGAGKYAWGSKVKLSATAKSGYAFYGWMAMDAASQNAFPKYDAQYRKNITPKITVPKGDVTYYACFISKSIDTISMSVTGATEFYAEDGTDSAEIYVSSYTYPTVKASGLPAGVTFKLVSGNDSRYKLNIAKPYSIPTGRHVVKVTAKNRSGKSVSKSFVIWGRNYTEAVDEGLMTIAKPSAKNPNKMTVGTIINWDSYSIKAADGRKITKVEGLPDGLKWSEKKQTLTGYPKKLGGFTLTFTVKKGGKKYKATASFVVEALPAGMVGTFKGYSKIKSGGSYKYGAGSRQATVSITKEGKISVSFGDVKFSGGGLTYEGGYYSIKLDASYKYKKITCHRYLTLDFDPSADYNENGIIGDYEEYFTKSGMTYDGTKELMIVRKNVFGRKDDGNAMVNEYAQSSLELVGYYHSEETITGSSPSHSVKVKLSKDANNRYNGLATLSGKVNGQSVSGTAMLMFEGTSNTDPNRALVARFTSGNSSIEVSYKIANTSTTKPTAKVYVK